MKELIRITIEEASETCGSTREEIFHFIEEEWIHPFEEDFLDDEDIARIRLIRDLMDQFGVNEESVPIILHLIDQLNALRIRFEGSTPGAGEL